MAEPESTGSVTCSTVEIHYHTTGTKRMLFVGKKDNIITVPFCAPELRTFILDSKNDEVHIHGKESCHYRMMTQTQKYCKVQIVFESGDPDMDLMRMEHADKMFSNGWKSCGVYAVKFDVPTVCEKWVKY